MADTLAPGAADAPEVTAPEAAPPVDGANSTDAQVLATPAAETPPATGAEAAPPPAIVPAARNRAEERIAELVAERNLYRDKLLATVPTAPAAKPAAETEPPKGPPMLAEFDYDTDQWAQAHAKWTDEQIERRAAAIVDRRLGETQQRSEADTLKTRWEGSVTEFEKAHPDFRETVFTDQLPVTPTMTEVIVRSDNPAALAYALGQNKPEALRISKLSPTLQAAALGKIEATLGQAPKPVAQAAKPVTRAPAPPSPIAAASPSSKKVEDMPIDEYIANRPWAYSNR